MYRIVEKLIYWRWDRYCRYDPIIKYLKNKYGHTRVKILEVGCGDYSMGLYDGYRIDGLDIREPDSKKHLNQFYKGSILSSEFAENSYDIVICVDFLEHLPEKDRKIAIHRMLSCARLELIMVFPEGLRSLEADKELYSVYKEKIHPFHLWFEEHIKFGLPLDTHVKKYISDYTQKKIKKVTVKKICDTSKHIFYSKLLMDPDYSTFLIKNKLVGLFDIFFGKFFQSGDCYRSMYFVELK